MANNEMGRVLYAHWDHLSPEEWSQFFVEGFYDWPGDGYGLWFRGTQDIVIRVGRHEGDYLEASYLEGVSEGLAGLVHEAWERGASWLHLDEYGEEIEGVPLCRRKRLIATGEVANG